MCSKLFLPPPPCPKNAPAIGVTERHPPPTHTEIFAFLATVQLSCYFSYLNHCSGNERERARAIERVCVSVFECVCVCVGEGGRVGGWGW